VISGCSYYFETWKGIDSEYITPVACSRTTRLQQHTGPEAT
jgi:hypothetical protein